MSIKVVTEVQHGYTRITGFVDNKEVMSVSNNVSKTFSVGCSTCLPSDIKTAALYVECFNQVFSQLELSK